MRCYKCMEEISDLKTCPYCGYDPSVEPENKQYLEPGTRLNGIYTIGTVIGAGGFGVTYIGWDEALNRKVAIKEYFPSSLSTRIPGQTSISAFSGEKQQIFNHGKERFIEEARLLMQFSGEDGIVTVYDVTEANGTVYMVMEYVEGITLKQSIERFGTIPEQQLVNFIVPMLLSLKYVHNAGFTHRDISPDNIMCQPDGSVKLLDFGAARYSVMEESRSLSVIVKHGFTPIEQYQSHGKQGPWTDLYAVGATMYKALTGITPDESLERMSNETLKKPSRCGAEVSENTENAIMAALNIRAEHRPQSVDEFLAILTGEKDGALVGGRPPKKRVVIAAVTALLAITVGGTSLLWGILQNGEEIRSDHRIEVPNAINKTNSDAEALFTEHQLKMSVTGGKLYDAEMIKQGYIAENLVVEQDPTGGTSVDPESTVGVVLSKGKEKEYVPSVTDKLTESALHDFEMNGFGDDFDIKLKEEYSDTNMPGTVISQSLPKDAATDFDGEITLTISIGRKDPLESVTTVTVDDYTGRDFDTLKQELIKDGIYLVKSASVYSAEYPYGAIISQSPKKGSEIKSGGAVYVITSLGVEMAPVPDVRYLTLDAAKAALMEIGLSWKVRYVVDPTVSYGLVAEQNTDPGIMTPFGTEIELLVSAETESEETKTAEDIEITPNNVELAVNETKTLSCSYTGDGNIIWASSNPYIAEVDDNGIVTAKSFGSVTISAAVNGNIATATVTVTDDSVITEVNDYELDIGESVSLSSAIPEAVLKDIIWRSSYPSVASVDDKGTVTAVGEGYTSITATYKNRTVECGIIVKKEKIKYASIRKDVLLGKLETAKQALSSKNILFNVTDEYNDTVSKGNIIKIKYVGYSDNDSFYIEEGSKVTLHCSLGKNTVSSIAIKTPPTKTTYSVGETPNYTGMVITVKYKDGTTKDISKGYSASSAALNTVGTQKITVTYEKQSTTVTFTVNPIAVSSISVTPTSLSLSIGASKTLTVTVKPLNATDKNVTVTSSNPSVVKVDGMKLTALKPGTATVTVRSGNGKTASCTVTVGAPDPSSISLSTARLTLKTGETTRLSATVLPQNAGNKNVTWKSSNTSIVTVDQNGEVRAIKAGNADITATTANGKTAVCKVTVTGNAVLTVKTKPTKTTYYIGDTFQSAGLVLSYTSASGATSDIKSGYELSYDMTREGSQTVKVTYNGLTTSFAISIKKPSITLSKTYVQGKMTLVVTTDPKGVNYKLESTNSKIFYFSNGQIVPVSSGTAYAIATMTYNGIEYSSPYCSITVEVEEEKNYTFRISGQQQDDACWRFAIQTDIPNFNRQNVEWSISTNADTESISGYFYVYPERQSFTVYASYVYNGKEYSASLRVTITVTEYTLQIVRSPNSVAGSRGIYTINTDIPNFDSSDIKWSIKGGSGQVQGNNFVVNESGMVAGDSYIVYATYTYGGQTVTATFTFSVRSGS